MWCRATESGPHPLRRPSPPAVTERRLLGFGGIPMLGAVEGVHHPHGSHDVMACGPHDWTEWNDHDPMTMWTPFLEDPMS